MAGYSGTPLAKKLGIREHDKVVVLSAPSSFGDKGSFEDTLGELPEDVELCSALPRSGQVAVIVLFVKAFRYWQPAVFAGPDALSVQ